VTCDRRGGDPLAHDIDHEELAELRDRVVLLSQDLARAEELRRHALAEVDEVGGILASAIRDVASLQAEKARLEERLLVVECEAASAKEEARMWHERFMRAEVLEGEWRDDAA
jgi:hypothetical protein